MAERRWFFPHLALDGHNRAYWKYPPVSFYDLKVSLDGSEEAIQWRLNALQAGHPPCEAD